MFDKKLLLQHIENRPRTVEEQSQKLASNMRTVYEQEESGIRRRRIHPDQYDHDHMTSDIKNLSKEEFADLYHPYRLMGDNPYGAPRGEKRMGEHVAHAASVVKSLTDVEREHHAENAHLPSYKGWLNRTITAGGEKLPVMAHINNIKKNAFISFARGAGITDREELGGHVKEFNKEFNYQTRDALEHPYGPDRDRPSFRF